MKKKLDELILYLFGRNPYLNFNPDGWTFDAGGWHSNFTHIKAILEQKKPLISIEVGTYKGASALLIAECIRQQNSGGKLICIDTWLGSLEHLPLGNSISEASQSQKKLLAVHGYPSLYQQFLFNVLSKNLESVIIPFPNTSVLAYKWLKRMGVKADFIYLDGSHEPEDVWLDLNHYYRLLADGGILVGDDYKWPGVHQSVQRFCQENSLSFSLDAEREVYTMLKKLRNTNK